MQKDFDSKFAPLCEDITTRFQSGGFLVGDIVKIRPDVLKNAKIKDKPSQFIDKIQELMGGKYPLKVCAVKTDRPTTSNNFYDVGSAPDGIWLDVAQVINPGFWSNVITLPAEVLDLQDYGANLPPAATSDQVYDNKIQITPVEVNVKDEELMKQTKGNDKERNKGKKNDGKMPTGEVKDGSDDVDKPDEYKYPRKGKTKKESVTLNAFEEDSEMIAEAYIANLPKE